ncbi:uncharacterized protein LOC144443611 [Glandiceps talaboti]
MSSLTEQKSHQQMYMTTKTIQLLYSVNASNECFHESNGADYRGTKSTTNKGNRCQKWTSQSPNTHTRTPDNYPSGGLGDHNYCRNPDNSAWPWCYTVDGLRYEYCDVGQPGYCETRLNSLQGKLVQLRGPVAVVATKPFPSAMSDVAVSFWIRSSGSSSGVIFTYAKANVPNEFSVRGLGNMKVYVHGSEGESSSVSANDGKWHHMVVTWTTTFGTWQIFKDGALANSAYYLAEGQQIQAGGLLVIGHGQFEAGVLEYMNGLYGDIADFNVWNRVLTSTEINGMTGGCDGAVTGSLISWDDNDLSVQSGTPGSSVLQESNSCKN